MLVNDPNVIVGSSGLASVKISDDKKIIITLKNGSTLIFTPKVQEDEVMNYEMLYLTGKENKQIARIKEKIASLQLQIIDIKDKDEGKNKDEDQNNDIEDNTLSNGDL